jgi:erythromycin esterase-like protein
MLREITSTAFGGCLITLTLMLVISSEARAQHSEADPAVRKAADFACRYQVVVLGELPSHGEARGFEAKAQIVRRLVNKCGFDALLFEAPIYDFIGFQTAAAKGSASSDQLDRAIGRFWLTRELADWRGWLLKRSGAGKLMLGGLDDQVSVTSQFARDTLPGLIASSVAASRSVECEEAVSRNLYWRYNSSVQFDEAEQRRLQRCADEAEARNNPEIANVGIEQLMIQNLASFIGRQTGSATAKDRDMAMYRNYLWHTAQLRRGSKIIIWTATVHAARIQGDLPQVPLGERLAEQLRDRVAVIGFTAFGGESSMAGRPPRILPDAPAGSLEALTAKKNSGWAFLRATDLKRLGNVPSRLLGKFISADWSMYFDGVLVTRQELAPTFQSQGPR